MPLHKPPGTTADVPEPIQETLREPLVAAAAKSNPADVVGEIEQRKEHGEETSSQHTAVDHRPGPSGGDSSKEDGHATGSEEEKEAELATHHANGLVDQTSYMPVRQILVVFMSMQLAVLLSFLDQTIVSTALPNISAAFNAGRSSAFVAAAYLLTSSAVQPVWGRLSDVFGRKVTLIACVVIFTIGSLACALAQTMLQLIIFRGMQGVGGGGLLTLVLIIISDIVSLKDRGKYQGITEITIMIGNGVGPVLGGVMAERLSWRWCFWINLPVAGASIVIIALFLPLKKVRGSAVEKLKKIDYGGAALTVSATVLLILPLNWGGTSFPWASGPVLGCLIAGFFTFGLFMVYEWKVAKIPICPPYIFKNRTVSAVFFTTFLNGATILCQLYYLPQLFQVVRGDSAIRSGVLIIPQLVTTTVFVATSGQLVARLGEYKVFICAGYAIWTIGLGLLSTLDEHSSTAKIVGFQLINGMGQGGTLQTSMVAAQAAVDRSDMSVVTSCRNFFRSLGGTIFLVIAATILNNNLRSKLTPLGFSSTTIDSVIDDPVGIWRTTTNTGSDLTSLTGTEKAQIISAYVEGFHRLFYVLIGLIGLNCIVATLLIGRHTLRRKDEDALKAKGKEWVDRQKAKKKGGADLDEAEKGAPAAKKEEEGEQEAAVERTAEAGQTRV
ncbi:hypothetical protein JCM8097_001777 [Rhodosporidiobolus ruineniae]